MIILTTSTIVRICTPWLALVLLLSTGQEAFTGEHLTDILQEKLHSDMPVSLSLISSPGLRQFTHHGCCARDADDRPATYAEVLAQPCSSWLSWCRIAVASQRAPSESLLLGVVVTIALIILYWQKTILSGFRATGRTGQQTPLLSIGSLAGC